MRTLSLLAVLALAAPAHAVPLELSHQGRLLDAAGVPLEGAHTLTVSLYESSSGGDAVWTEDVEVDVDAGYYSVVLGEGTALDASLFGGGALYVGIAVDDGSELTPRQPIVSVPYAVTAGSVSGGVVDATEIRVGGATIIDSDGQIDPSALGSSDTLAELECELHQVARWDGSSWICADDMDHAHDAADLITGTIDMARLPVGTTGDHVAAGDHDHAGEFLPAGALAMFEGVQRPCDDGAGVQTFDGSAWGDCDLEWTCLDDPGHAGCVAGSEYASCSEILADPTFVPTDGAYWIDPDGSGPNAPFEAWCDMTTDGGGWQLVGWMRTGSHSFSNYQKWANYKSSSETVEPFSPGMPSWIDSMQTKLGNHALNVRMTYAQQNQSTLDLDGHTRVYTTGSSWKGAFATSNPLPSGARETEAINCDGYRYFEPSGREHELDKGCYIEFTDHHRGNWAGCGSNAYDAGGAAWGLCFDNGHGDGSEGNSALNIWHIGNPGYHEIYHLNYGTNAPANGAWNHNGGSWTWSAWVRY